MTMRLRACAVLLLFLSACATSAPGPRARSPRVANLQRAAALPWKDGGRCAVQQASQPWPVLVERCFQALDQERIRFHDPTGRCTVASAGAAALGLGLCVLVAPEIIVGAVIVTGVVVAAVAIKEALDAYELSAGHDEEVKPVPRTLQPQAERKPQPEPSGKGRPPPLPPEPEGQENSPECKPRKVKHRGGDALHNRCADRIPLNDFSGGDALVNGKNFDGLQLRERVLWEVKTDNFDTYSSFLQQRAVENQLPDLLEERALALACGFGFKIGVRSAAHKAALFGLDPSLEVVVMDWC
ncbi:MAG TPA: DUF6310 domain-containing protein [Myxococcus sp.]|nr:DUF6310 domain-containing protein [Myxococcus sp.]